MGFLSFPPGSADPMDFEVDFEPVMESQNGAAIALLIRYGTWVGASINVLNAREDTVDGFELRTVFEGWEGNA